MLLKLATLSREIEKILHLRLMGYCEYKKSFYFVNRTKLKCFNIQHSDFPVDRHLNIGGNNDELFF